MIAARLHQGNLRAGLLGWRLWSLVGLTLLSSEGGAAPLSVSVPVSATVVQVVSVSDSLAPVSATLSTSSGWVAVQVVGASPLPSTLTAPSPLPELSGAAPQSVLLLGGVRPALGDVEAGGTPTWWLLEWQDRQGAGLLRGGAMATALQLELPNPVDTGSQGPAPYSVIVAFN